MLRLPAAISLAILVTAAVPSFANDADAEKGAAAPALSSMAPLAGDLDWSLSPVRVGMSRGAVLPALYASLGAMNAVDAFMTSKGLSGGAVEANPLMRQAVQNPGVFWAVKGGATATSIFLAERLWRSNRKAQAIAVMALSNGVMAAVAARNAHVLQQR